jgi:hypothetical protein
VFLASATRAHQGQEQTEASNANGEMTHE